MAGRQVNGFWTRWRLPASRETHSDWPRLEGHGAVRRSADGWCVETASGSKLGSAYDGGILAHALRHKPAPVAADRCVRVKLGVEDFADFIELALADRHQQLEQVFLHGRSGAPNQPQIQQRDAPVVGERDVSRVGNYEKSRVSPHGIPLMIWYGVLAKRSRKLHHPNHNGRS